MLKQKLDSVEIDMKYTLLKKKYVYNKNESTNVKIKWKRQ